MRTGKKKPDPRFIGTQFSVWVADGNGRDHVIYFPTCPTGAFGQHLGPDEITHQVAEEIKGALLATLLWWERFAPRRGPGTVVSLKPEKGHNP